MNLKNFIVFILFLTVPSLLYPQGRTMKTDELLGQLNTITTAVPFLIIAPDARSGAMGDGGVATSPDAMSMHWNPAKYAFAAKDMGIGISYSPWLRALVPDINLAYLSGYKKIDKMQAVGVSLLYFNLGEIIFTDVVGNTTGQFKPHEFALDGTYSRKFNDYFSGAIAFRYIYSNLTGNAFQGSQQFFPGQSFAVDIAMYYEKVLERSKNKNKLAFGANISNIGAKISYSETTERDFIPINLRLGPCFTWNIDQYNSLSFHVDLNKLLVPTPPRYLKDDKGNPVYEDGKQVIEYGKDPNVSVITGMFQSFSDAPGGMTEELREIMYSVGTEYWYDKQFAIRGGYFWEHETKGNRKFFTLGAGVKYNVFGLDFAYLIPASSEVKSPLENTLRFTLTFDFEAFKNQKP